MSHLPGLLHWVGDELQHTDCKMHPSIVLMNRNVLLTLTILMRTPYNLCLPKAPPPNPVTLETSVQHVALEGGDAVNLRL